MAANDLIAETHAQSPAFDLYTLIVQNPQAFQDILTKTASALLATFLGFVLILLWRKFSTSIWRFLAYLGSFRGLSRLALWAYRRSLISHYGKLINIYLDKEEELSLNQVFVPLTLRASKVTDLADNRSTEKILTDPGQKRLLLLGAPGSGKSTLLKALAAGISRREWPQFGDLVPVLVSLREFAQAVDKKSLITWLSENELPRFDLKKSRPLLEALLAKGQVLLMLDGLDEVAGDRLEAINRAISSLLDDFDKTKSCRVLLTCREQNYDDLPDRRHYTRAGFTEYRVAELRDSEIRAIVHRRKSSFTEKQKSIANYLEQVFRHSDILQLHRNPLLLTLSMGVFLHKPGEEVPHYLAQFYEQAIDNLLRRHDFRETKGGRSANHFKAECKFRLLRTFAWSNLISAGEQHWDFETFSFQSVTEAARELAEAGKVAFKPDEAHAVVKEIQLQAGLLNALQDGECYLYAHRSLNEYCAAATLNRQNETGFRQICAQLGNTAWRQVIFFYAAIDDDNDNAVRLVEAIKERAEQEHDDNLLALAGHCAAVMVQPRPQLRLVLLEALAAALFATADTPTRGILLKSLLALGNSRDETLRQQLDGAMRRLVEAGHVDELINEIGRLESAVALQFLGYLANSVDLSRKKTALRGLSQFESLDAIPLLWQLVLDFRGAGDAESKTDTLDELFYLMAEPGAVDRLNECDMSINVDEATRQRLCKIYPFQSTGQPFSHLAWLLTFTVDAGYSVDRLITEDKTWRLFLDIILSNKSAEELRVWQRLPRDKNKSTPNVHCVVIGRCLFGLPLLLGVLLAGLYLWRTRCEEFEIYLMVLASFFTGLLIIPRVWALWSYVLNHWGFLGTMEAFPSVVRSGLLRDNRLVGASQFRRRWPVIFWGFSRAVFFVSPICLFGLAALLHNPAISGHEESVLSLATTSTAPWVLTGSQDNTARLWDSKTGAELRQFEHDRTVNAVAFAPDGLTVLTGSSDSTARLWDSITGAELRQFEHDHAVNAVAFAPNGLTVLTGSSDNTARLWDSKTGAELRRFYHDDSVYAVAFAPDGLTVMTGSNDMTMRLWDSKSGAELWRFDGDNHVYAPFEAVAFAPDGLTVLTGSLDTTAQLLDSKTGAVLRRFLHDDSVRAVGFTPDGSGIYTGADNDVLRLWNRQTGALMWATPTPFWNRATLKIRILYIWLALVFLVFFLPSLNWFDRGRLWYLRKPNRYIHLYQIPGVDRWLPPE